MFGRRSQPVPSAPADTSEKRNDSDKTLTDEPVPTHAQVKRATRTRFLWTLCASFLLLISVVFLILVEIGDISRHSTYPKIYFININLTNIVPISVPDAVLINSIAESLGLHDFYTVGLWGYCEGYNGQGTTSCSTPKALYWFDPVAILESQLLAGAVIALPEEINTILKVIHLISNWMFGLFLVGACLNFLMMFLAPLAIYSRWATLPIMLLTAFGALCTTVATVLATAMFIVIKDALTSVTSLNIKASLGIPMFVFMWIAAGTSILAWLIQLCLTCCCASRRDVRKGKKRGSKKAWRTREPEVGDGPPAR